MSFHNIEKKNFFYKLLHLYTTFAHNKLFYRKVYILNADKIPKNAHLIFTPNHQNALMDALGPLCNIDKQLVFLARSDIFKKKFVASILYFLKILPVFRIRDGYSEVKKNKSIFQKTIDVINAQNGLVILPEGNHEGIHQLRQFKKGFARIAFQTEESNDFELDIKIVPMGLHYSDYISSGSDLYINFGEPLNVSAYYELYKEAPAKAVNKLTSDLAEEIKPLMVHIESADNYDFYDSIRLLYWRNMCNPNNKKKCADSMRIMAEQEAISLLGLIEKETPEKFDQLNQLNKTYTAGLHKNSLNDESFCKPAKPLNLIFKSLGFLVGLPIFLYGFFTNLVPFVIVKYAESLIKDLQFKSSFKFVLSLIVFPLFYLIPIVLIIIFCSSLFLGILIFLSLPSTGFFAIRYAHAFKQFKIIWKYMTFKSRNPSQFENMNTVKASMDQIVNNAKINFQTAG